MQRYRQQVGMSDIWNERIGTTHTMRENILLYLLQEGEVKKEEVRRTIGMTDDSAGKHLRFLEEHEYVEKQLVNGGMRSQYQLTEKGEELVGDIRWGDQA